MPAPPRTTHLIGGDRCAPQEWARTRQTTRCPGLRTGPATSRGGCSIGPTGFDALVRSLHRPTSRRLLAGLLGATLAGSLGGVTDAKRQRQRHERRLKAQKGNSPTAKRCQKGGWRTLARAEDPTIPFTSEEECVSYGAQVGPPVPLVVNPCYGEPDLTACSAGVCCDQQCQTGACCPENNAGCSGTTPFCHEGSCEGCTSDGDCGSGGVCTPTAPVR